MNKVILSGNLVRDVELKQSQGSNGVVNNRIAVKRDFKNAKGEYDSDFINFVAWGNQAEYLGKYAKKGDRVELVGRWQVRTYQNQQGNNCESNEVVVENITVFSRQPTDPKQPQQPVSFDEDELPF